MKMLFMGQAPGPRGIRQFPLKGLAPKLGEIFGIGAREFLKQDRFNLLNEHRGKSGKGDYFPLAEARESADQWKPLLPSWDRIVLLGMGVARAFGLKPKYGLARLGGKIVFVFPHPSGVNLWWNHARNVQSMGRRVRRYLNHRQASKVELG